MGHDDDRTGSTAVITGAARGFGRAFAKALHDRGAHVVLIDLDADEVQKAASAIGRSSGRAVGVTGDVTDEARMNEVMAGVAGTSGGIDILINNAGLHSEEYSKPVAELGVAKVRRLFDVNVMGVVTCTLAAAPYLRAGGSVVNIASAAAHSSTTAYGASKLAVAGLTITFARELGSSGIRVNAISPGMILTETIRDELPAQTKSYVKSMQMLDRDGAEIDVVEAMLFLTSPHSARFITGETLRVTGGMAAGV